MILQHTYPSAVLSVKMNRLRLVVCLEESLYIHNIRDMSILHTIRDTPPNPRGVSTFLTASSSLELILKVCALAATDADDSCGYLAYPGSPIAGELNIFDTVNLRAVTQLNAHDNPIGKTYFTFVILIFSKLLLLWIKLEQRLPLPLIKALSFAFSPSPQVSSV